MALVAHGVHDDHGGVDGAAQGQHGAHGYGRVEGSEGLQLTHVERTVSQLTQH